MPFKLAQAPRGLLELFKLKTDGHQPNQFSEVVSPVVDVTDFYAADSLLNGFVNAGAGALPRSASTTAFGSAVRVHGMEALLAIGAGALAGGMYWWEIQLSDASGASCALATGYVNVPAGVALAAGIILVGGGQLSYPRLVTPGMFLSARWSSNDPAATHAPQLRFQFENIIAL